MLLQRCCGLLKRGRPALSWINRLFNLFHGSKLNRDLDEELSFHLEARVRDNLAAGMMPGEAQQDAKVRFGNQTLLKERTRDMDLLQTLETVAQDVRHAVRGLSQSRGFAVTAILSLALGIGASTAIFSVTDNLLLRPLPYRDPMRLMMLWETRPQRGSEHNVVSPGNFFDWKAQNTVFESTAAFRESRSVLTDGNHAEELGKQSMSAALLPMLGVVPVRGRLFTHEEDQAAIHSDSVLLISYRLWQSWFGGDPNIIGRHVQMNSMPRTIIGVMPPGFSFRNRTTDLWEPLGLNSAENYRKTQGRWMLVIARLKPGVTVAQAQAQMTAISQRLATTYPDFDKNWTATVEPLRDSLVREVRRSLLILLGAVGLLLAVACANVGNLLLARFTSRRQEMAVRASLGATRWRIVRQVLTESVILGLLAGLLGIILARWMVAGLLTMAPKELTQSANVSVDFRIFLFSIALSAFTGLLFGMGPSFATSHIELTRALGDGSRSSTGSGRLRSWLVSAEVALSLILLTGAGLLFQSMIRLQRVDPGIEASGLLTFRVSLPAARYRQIARRQQFFATALEQIDRLPGVRSASAVSYLPFDGDAAGTWVNIAGKPKARPGEELLAIIRTVMPGYFRTMGIPLRRGRDFGAADNTQAAPYRFIVNEAFAKKYLANENPLGQSINALMDTKNPFGEIVGVVGDVKEGALDQDPMPTVYYVYSHLPHPSMIFVARSTGNPPALAEPARRVIRGIDRGQPISEIHTMQEVIGQTFARQRFSALLLSAFSIIAVLLASIGIYGVLAYSVSERSREFGVRAALGAEPRRIITLVLGAGVRLVVVGSAVGVTGALALSSALKNLLFDIGPRDPFTFVAAPLLLFCIALLAAYVPARRATLVDPVTTLRAQ